MHRFPKATLLLILAAALLLSACPYHHGRGYDDDGPHHGRGYDDGPRHMRQNPPSRY